jgi:hypothetical protein
MFRSHQVGQPIDVADVDGRYERVGNFQGSHAGS